MGALQARSPDSLSTSGPWAGQPPGRNPGGGAQCPWPSGWRTAGREELQHPAGEDCDLRRPRQGPWSPATLTELRVARLRAASLRRLQSGPGRA